MQYRPPRARGTVGRLLGAALPPLLLLAAVVAVERPTPNPEEVRFAGQAPSVGAALAARVNDRVRALDLLAPLFAGGDEPSWREFSELPRAGLPKRGEHELFVWVPRVPAKERLTYEQSNGRSALRSFHIREMDQNGPRPAAPRATYHPIHLVDPPQAAEQLLGLDLASDLRVLAAFERCRDTGLPEVLGPVVVGAPDSSGAKLLLARPLFKTTFAPAQIAERRRDLRGFVVATIDVGSALRNAGLGDEAALRGLEVHVSGTAPDPKEASGLARPTVSIIGRERGLAWTGLLDLEGRGFALRVSAPATRR
jgi:CHASE1-domain containing sensor protein